MTDRTEFQRGWDAAMESASNAIRDAERSRMNALQLAAHAHNLAKMAAEVMAPAAELYRWEVDHETASPVLLEELEQFYKLTGNAGVPGIYDDVRFGTDINGASSIHPEGSGDHDD